MLARDRIRRTIRPPVRFSDSDFNAYAMQVAENLNYHEPKTFDEAIKSRHSENWFNAMKDEIESLHKNKTWKLVPRAENKSVIDCKWVFKVKKEIDGERFKARLVAKGFTQKEGIDYSEIFAPVAKFTTIRVMLALVAHFNWELIQMDVKTTFLHGEIDKEIFMKQPPGFEDKMKPNHVCLLKKALYGFKQAPRQWNLKFDKCMKEMGECVCVGCHLFGSWVIGAVIFFTFVSNGCSWFGYFIWAL